MKRIKLVIAALALSIGIGGTTLALSAPAGATSETFSCANGPNSTQSCTALINYWFNYVSVIRASVSYARTPVGTGLLFLIKDNSNGYAQFEYGYGSNPYYASVTVNRTFPAGSDVCSENFYEMGTNNWVPQAWSCVVVP